MKLCHKLDLCPIHTKAFISCLVKHSLKLFRFIKAAFGFLSTTDLEQVKVYLSPMSKLMAQLSVTNFNFVKPGLIKHVLLV